MAHELTNLLPPERARSLRRLYFMRLATVGILMLGGIVVAHGVLLLPSYLYVSEQVRSREAALASFSSTLAGSEEQEVKARIAALNEDASHLSSLAETPAASALIRALLAVPHPGIRLSGFTYTPAINGAEPKMSLSGVAASREALRRYDEALASLPYVSDTDLPISAYAKESDIAFSIALTGPLMP